LFSEQTGVFLSETDSERFLEIFGLIEK